MGTVQVEADVAIVGGGSAGCMCAIHLLENDPDLKVAVLEKSTLKRGGCAATGIDHYIGISPKFYGVKKRHFYKDLLFRILLPSLSGRGEVGLTAYNGPEIFDESYEGMMKLEEMGVRVRDDRGEFRVVSAAGAQAIWIEGADVKPIFAKRVRSLGATVFERTTGQQLLVDGGRVCGVVGFDYRSGDFVRVDAPAVVVTTGAVNRIWEPVLRDSSAAPFDMAYCPYDNGEGQRAALMAGAELQNAEFLAGTIAPADWATPGISGFLSVGCRIRNSRGEDIMARYDPRGGDAPARERIVYGMHRELVAGRGPIYIDTSELSPEQVEDIKNAWSNEVPLMHRYVGAKGLTIGRDPLEAEIHFAVSTPRIINGPDMMAPGLPGLFAAGDDCTTAAVAFMGTMIGGARSAKGVAGYLKDAPQVDPGRSDVQAKEAEERLFSYIGREGGLGWWDLERELRRVMTRYFGLVRNETGMRAGREKVKELLGMRDRLSASNHHELMRLHETICLLELAGLTAETAILRRESRAEGQASYHVRSDFPRRDPKSGRTILVASMESGRLKVEERRALEKPLQFLMRSAKMLFLGPRFK